jgi:hypothetical protein
MPWPGARMLAKELERAAGHRAAQGWRLTRPPRDWQWSSSQHAGAPEPALSESPERQGRFRCSSPQRARPAPGRVRGPDHDDASGGGGPFKLGEGQWQRAARSTVAHRARLLANEVRSTVRGSRWWSCVSGPRSAWPGVCYSNTKRSDQIRFAFPTNLSHSH